MSSHKDNKHSAVLSSSADGTTTATADGSTVHSTDPTTNPDASLAQKIKGDVSGALKGTVGSVQAAVGSVGSQSMKEKGLTKMQEEDERLGAKRGVMPVGSGQRHEKGETTATQ
ncbi:hypothetical protein F5Y15DRAFT_412416 [Xylariaceae sp. FL0016]|nr:hypothetical protein F5Y15DRAFT_412416 [Xylariaceae sp. FL0016]